MIGRFRTQWKCERDNVHVQGKLHAIMEFSSRQYVTILPNAYNSTNQIPDDFQTYLKTTLPLLNPANPLRNIPLRIYIPSSLPYEAPTSPSDPDTPLYTFKIVQTLIPPRTSSREAQTLGSALHEILPSLFPSRRDAILAEPVLHGAAVPFRAPLEEVMREAAYADGWVHLCVRMIDAE
jgi:autophagy-related protein 5